MKIFQFKNKNGKSSGITLIALVVTIIVLLILAGISISMLSGENGILQRATDAKELTGIGQIIEDVKLAATDGISKYYIGEEENIVTAVENSISTNVIGFKEFTSTRGTSPVEGLIIRNGKEHAFSVDANSGSAVVLEKKVDYQWILSGDYDNDGVISIGDQVTPLIESVELEKFSVVAINDNYIQLITDKPVNYIRKLSRLK